MSWSLGKSIQIKTYVNSCKIHKLVQKEKQSLFKGNDHLTEIQLIEIVIFQLIESFN